MFTTEQYRLQNDAKSLKKAVAADGMGLVLPKVVKKGLSYRDITMALGICVALLIVLTLWASRKRPVLSDAGTPGMTITTAVSSIQDLIRKSTLVEF